MSTARRPRRRANRASERTLLRSQGSRVPPTAGRGNSPLECTGGGLSQVPLQAGDCIQHCRTGRGCPARERKGRPGRGRGHERGPGVALAPDAGRRHNKGRLQMTGAALKWLTNQRLGLLRGLAQLCARRESHTLVGRNRHQAPTTADRPNTPRLHLPHLE